ncbi:MAG: CinA family protein [Nakamurella sp.]
MKQDTVQRLVEDFAARGWTVATAESLTAGLLAAAITEIPGSSAVLRGGIVCYATDLKSTLVGVDADLLARVGPVDPTVAAQLAAGARLRCGADVGIALTGVAGPDPQSGHRPGTVYVARSGLGREVCQRLALTDPPGTRGQVRAAAVRCAIALLQDLMEQG